MQQMAQKFIIDNMTVLIRKKVSDLVNSGATDDEKILEEVMRKTKEVKSFEASMSQFGISMEMVEAVARTEIKTALTSKLIEVNEENKTGMSKFSRYIRRNFKKF